MTPNAILQQHEPGLEPVDVAVDHVRGSPAGRLIVEYDDLRRYATGLGLDLMLFDHDRAGTAVLERVRRDVQSGIASGEVLGTPTLSIDGVVHRGGYDTAVLLEALAR